MGCAQSAAPDLDLSAEEGYVFVVLIRE